MSRLVTLTGNVGAPRNYEVLIGTPMDELLALAAPKDDTDGIIMGGPMMGFLVPDGKVPVVKATNCLIAHSPALFPPKAPEMLLKLGMSLAALDNKDTACATLREVGKRYPNASPAVSAKVKSEQSRLAC